MGTAAWLPLGNLMKNAIKAFLGPYHVARLRHVKRQIEVKHFNKGEPDLVG